MSNSTFFSCKIGTTNALVPLGLEIWINREQLLALTPVNSTVTFQKALDDLADGPHELKFILKNKTSEHTVIDDNGAIVADATVTISDVAFEEIDLGQLLIDHAVYEHDFNGTQQLGQHKFYGEMGCNGTVSLEFTTPIYIWLLENM